MSIEFIGKCSPEVSQIKDLARDGFKKAELYMAEKHLKEEKYIENVVDQRKISEVDFYSVHTPHAKPDNFLEVLEKTKQFARDGKIKVVVVHSSYVDVFSDEVLVDCGPNVLPENDFDHDLPFFEDFFRKNQRICFDIAHFQIASHRSGRNFYEDLETLFTKYPGYIGHLHLNDGTKEKDDIDVGDGEINFMRAMSIIWKNYSGVAVVETSRKNQLRDAKRLEKTVSFVSRTKF